MALFAKVFVLFCLVLAVSSADPPANNEPASQFTLLICQNWVVIANGILNDLNTELSHSLIYFIDYIYSFQDLNPGQKKDEFMSAINPEWMNLNETLQTIFDIAKYKIARKFNLSMNQTQELLEKPDTFKLPFSCIRYILEKMIKSYKGTVDQISFSVDIITQLHN